MATGCHNQLGLSFQPKLVLDFNGGKITSDSGLLLLRQVDAQLALTKKLTGLCNDEGTEGSGTEGSNLKLNSCHWFWYPHLIPSTVETV